MMIVSEVFKMQVLLDGLTLFIAVIYIFIGIMFEPEYTFIVHSNLVTVGVVQYILRLLIHLVLLIQYTVRLFKPTLDCAWLWFNLFTFVVMLGGYITGLVYFPLPYLLIVTVALIKDIWPRRVL